VPYAASCPNTPNGRALANLVIALDSDRAQLASLLAGLLDSNEQDVAGAK
jgi:hypothetical protein